MPDLIRTLPSLSKSLSPLLKEESSLIGVDGLHGVGKTHLAKELADSFSVTHVEIDELIEGNGEPYVSQVRCGELLEKIANASRPVIVDGVCLLDVMAKCHLRLNAHIYLRRVGGEGSLANERRHIEEGQVEQLASIRRRVLAAMNEDSSSKVDRLPVQIAQYHRDYKPREVADFLFELADT